MGATVVFKTPQELFRSRSLVTGSDMTPRVGTVKCVPSLLKSLWQQNIVSSETTGPSVLPLGAHISHEYVYIPGSHIRCPFWVSLPSLCSCVSNLPYYLGSGVDLAHILASVKWVCPGNVGGMPDRCHREPLLAIRVYYLLPLCKAPPEAVEGTQLQEKSVLVKPECVGPLQDDRLPTSQWC